jgi:hypothetical protein
MVDNDNNNNHECWRTDGNNVDANDWLGTRNNQPLRIRGRANRRVTFRTWRLSGRSNRGFITRRCIRYSPIGASSKD